MPRRVDQQVASALLSSSLRYVLLDIDGVLWRGTNVIDGAPEALQHLRSCGKELRFLTNNASLSRRELLHTFSKRGFSGVREEEIINSGYAAALRLQQQIGQRESPDAPLLVHGNVFVVGEAGLHEEIRSVLAPGFITYGCELHDAQAVGGYDGSRIATAWSCPTLPPPQQRLVVCNGTMCRMIQAGTPGAENISLSDLNAVAVVAGLDIHFNILTLAYASMILQGKPKQEDGGSGEDARAIFIATNEDAQIPVGADQILLPGAGSMIQSLKVVSGRNPSSVCGKPHTNMAEILFTRENITSPQTSCLMVGDRLSTDVAFGNRAGCQTMLVLTGAEGLADVEEAQRDESRSDEVPTYIADSLASFLPS